MDSRRTALAALISVAVVVILVGRSYIRRDSDAKAADTPQMMTTGATVGYSDSLFGCPSAFSGKHCLFDGFLYSLDGSTSESLTPRAALLPTPDENGNEAHGSNLLLLPSGTGYLEREQWIKS